MDAIYLLARHEVTPHRLSKGVDAGAVAKGYSFELAAKEGCVKA
jgi:hypothetical protein